jgi:hypothetical protein
MFPLREKCPGLIGRLILKSFFNPKYEGNFKYELFFPFGTLRAILKWKNRFKMKPTNKTKLNLAGVDVVIPFFKAT